MRMMTATMANIFFELTDGIPGAMWIGDGISYYFGLLGGSLNRSERWDGPVRMGVSFICPPDIHHCSVMIRRWAMPEGRSSLGDIGDALGIEAETGCYT